ncbi:unnamed protein product [marine sediment metagenome]|uniref:Uncharacterized protein n=1 Tax=marine sediment metagenome TaxID=412755 RepID=X0T673_9ZZZZ
MSKWTKAKALALWKELPEYINPLQFMTPIEDKQRGSRYGACGVRIDGNPQFVDAVLSCLKPLIAGESGTTRLGLSRSPVTGKFKAAPHADTDAEVCYIRLHRRGSAVARPREVQSAPVDRRSERFSQAYTG